MRNVASIFRPSLFQSKVAIVTGGGSGIGKAITEELSLLGCNVVIASRDERKLAGAAEALNTARTADEDTNTETIGQMTEQSSKGRVFFQKCNIREEEEVISLIRDTVDRHGRLDYLVNNGGGQFPSPAETISKKGWEAVIQTNLTGTFLCCKHAYNLYMRDNGGSIVNIVADMWKGFPGMCHTGAARAAVVNLTQSLAIEWAENGVRVNSVAPGVIWSSSAAANYKDPSLLYSTVPNIPAKRLGTVEEVSAAVTYLLSPAAAFVTGETLRVDGGSSIYRTLWEIPQHTSLPAYGTCPVEMEEEHDEEKDLPEKTGSSKL